MSDTIDILPHIQGVAADLRSYVGRLRDQHGSEEILNVIIPEEVGRGRQSTYLLRRAKAQLIKATLLAEPGIVITNITHYDVSEVPDPREAPGWRHVAIVLVSAVHNATLRALAYARSLHADEVLCVHVATDDHESERICNDWEAWSPGSPLIVDDGRSSRISAAVLAAVDRVFGDHARMFVTVVLPEFVVSRWWHNLLHEQTALVLKRALLFEPSVVAVTSVPYRLGTDRDVPEVERELQM